MIVIPEESIRYESLVTILDMTREKKLPGVNAKGESRYASLFPVTVFTKRNKPPPEKVLEEEGGDEGAAP